MWQQLLLWNIVKLTFIEGKIRLKRWLTDFLHVTVKRLHFPCPHFPLTPTSAPQNTKEKSGEWQTGGVEEKEKNRKVGVVTLGSKASCLPSTLHHSLCATLAFGGIGVNCHWCHSAINHTVTRSDGLRVVERKPPAKRHRGKKSPPVYPREQLLLPN